MTTHSTQALLIRAANAATERGEFRQREHERRTEEYRAERELWISRQGPALQKEARYVLECIRKGRVPSWERTYTLRQRTPGERPEKRDAGLEERQAWMLVRFLYTVTDETITTAALERAGFRGIAWLLRGSEVES